MTIDIIGAGIGGLTTAIALEQKGFNVRIFEQANEIKPVGAGIILASNAMRVYEKLGLRNIIEESGNPVSFMNITKANLNTISKTDLSYFEKKYKVKSIAIHRGVLQQILVNKLKTTEINLNHQLNKLVKNDNGYTLMFDNGSTHQSTVLIGADGLNSLVRQNVFLNNEIRKAHQISWRGITNFDLPSDYKNGLIEAWGNSGRFGFVQIDQKKVYWYGVKSFKVDKNEFSVDSIDTYFSDYDSIIKNLIKSTKKDKIFTGEIADLKPSNIWYKENVCLIGDAAHATTPNLGQGACQAIEDAYILSDYLDKYETDIAFEKFQKLRLPRVHRVVKTSWIIGKIAHISNPVLIAIRNQIMRMTPSSVNRNNLNRILE